MGSAFPEYLVMILLLALVAVFEFAYVRRVHRALAGRHRRHAAALPRYPLGRAALAFRDRDGPADPGRTRDALARLLAIGNALGSPLAQRQADVVLASALPIGLTDEPGRHLSGRCVTVAPGAVGAAAEVELTAPQTLIAPGTGGEAQPALRRFAAEEFPVPLGSAPAGATSTLAIPADKSSQPWHLHVEGAGPVSVCQAAG